MIWAARWGLIVRGVELTEICRLRFCQSTCHWACRADRPVYPVVGAF